jgi:hypothetical protein
VPVPQAADITTQFVNALRTHNKAAMDTLKDLPGLDLERVDPASRMTIAELCAEAGQPELAAELLGRGADAFRGAQPLLSIAIEHGHLELLRCIIDRHKASLRVDVSLSLHALPSTALHIAAKLGRVEVMKLLLAHMQRMRLLGVAMDIDVKEPTGLMTPLGIAGVTRNEAMAILLVNAGANVCAWNGPQRRNFLYILAEIGTWGLLKAFLIGADAAETDAIRITGGEDDAAVTAAAAAAASRRFSGETVLMKPSFHVNSPVCESGSTLLHAAALHNKAHIVRRLLAMGADPNATTNATQRGTQSGVGEPKNMGGRATPLFHALANSGSAAACELIAHPGMCRALLTFSNLPVHTHF